MTDLMFIGWRWITLMQRIVAMLTRMTIQFDGTSKAPGNYLIEHEHEQEGVGDK